MQLLRDCLYLVGGRAFFMKPIGYAVGNVYAVRTDSGVILIDCASDEASLEVIFENLRYWGMDPNTISHVLLTHSHWDHTYNARTLQERGAKLVAHHTVADALLKGDERTIHYTVHRTDFPTCKVDIELGDHETFVAAGQSFEAINVPGHSDGSMVFITTCDGRKVMFIGDYVFHDRPQTTEMSLAWNGGTEWDTDKFIEGLLRVQRIRVDVVLPGHNGFLMNHGSAIIDNGLTVALRAWGNGYASRHPKTD